MHAMPEEVLFKSDELLPRRKIAEQLRAAADEVGSGDVLLEASEESVDVSVPAKSLFEVKLERLTDSETGEERYELEYEIRWTR